MRQAGAPEGAFHGLMATGAEALAIGNCLLHKDEQDPSLKVSDKDSFERD